MEMWCPDDIGRDSWDWVGPPAWGRACFNSPEWGGGSSPVKTEPPQIVLLLLLLLLWLWLCYGLIVQEPSTICGTGTSFDGAMSVVSTICSTVRRWSLSCGLTSKSRSSRALSVSSSNKSKNTESSLELAVIWLREASYVSGPAPWNEEWCKAAANSMRTVIRSCRSHERSRRSLLRLAADLPESRATKGIVTRQGFDQKRHTQTRGQLWVKRLVVEWLYYSKRIIIVRWADLSDFFVDFRRKNEYFCFTSNDNCHFSSEKTITSQNGLLIFLWTETHSETKSWKSARLLMNKVTTTTANPGNRRRFCV